MINKYKYPLIGALIGLLIATSFFTIGFFKTIIIILLAIIGGLVGFYIQQNNIVELLAKKIKKNN